MEEKKYGYEAVTQTVGIEAKRGQDEECSQSVDLYEQTDDQPVQCDDRLSSVVSRSGAGDSLSASSEKHNCRGEGRIHGNRHCREHMEEEELSEEDAGTLYGKFFRCSHILHRRVGGSSSCQQILSLLQNGKMTQKEIQDHLGIQAGSLSGLMASLERKELIVREKDEEDKRRILVGITEKGMEKVSQSRPITDEELFAALTEEEREALQGMLDKMIAAHAAWKKGRGLS